MIEGAIEVDTLNPTRLGGVGKELEAHLGVRLVAAGFLALASSCQTD